MIDYDKKNRQRRKQWLCSTGYLGTSSGIANSSTGAFWKQTTIPMGSFFTQMVTIDWGRLSCWKMLKDLEKKKTCRKSIWAISGCCIDNQASFVEETRQATMRFFNLPDGCRLVQKEIEKDRQRKVNWSIRLSTNKEKQGNWKERERGVQQSVAIIFQSTFKLPSYTHRLPEQDQQNFFPQALFYPEFCSEGPLPF